jgi:hypothetical protein
LRREWEREEVVEKERRRDVFVCFDFRDFGLLI